MSKTIKVLPSVNNIDFCGRLVREPYVSKSGNVMIFDLIRNFGGEKAPVIMTFVMFKPKSGFPAFLKKGAPVIAHAYVTPVAYTNKDGEPVEEVQKVIKSVEEAVLVEKKVSDEEAAEAEAADGVEIKED